LRYFQAFFIFHKNTPVTTDFYFFGLEKIQITQNLAPNKPILDIQKVKIWKEIWGKNLVITLFEDVQGL